LSPCATCHRLGIQKCNHQADRQIGYSRKPHGLSAALANRRLRRRAFVAHGTKRSLGRDYPDTVTGRACYYLRSMKTWRLTAKDCVYAPIRDIGSAPKGAMPEEVTKVTAPQRFTRSTKTALSDATVLPPTTKAAEWRPSFFISLPSDGVCSAGGSGCRVPHCIFANLHWICGLVFVPPSAALTRTYLKIIGCCRCAIKVE
jgi:hypothetical protein